MSQFFYFWMCNGPVSVDEELLIFFEFLPECFNDSNIFSGFLLDFAKWMVKKNKKWDKDLSASLNMSD